MKIGLTYDLKSEYLAQGHSLDEVAEFDAVETIDALESALRALGAEAVRIGGVRQLVLRLARGERWDLVLNIAEGLRGFGREAQIPALLEAYDIPYTFSDPLTLSVTLHKAMAKRVVRDCGITTPPFAVVTTLADLQKIELPYPLFAKPIAEGTSKGIGDESKVNGPRELERVCAGLLARYDQPVLVEEFLPGREFTIGVLGTGDDAFAVGALEIVFSPGTGSAIYSYDGKTTTAASPAFVVATDADAERAMQVGLAAWRALGCRDGGRIDVRLDKRGIPNFIEANPLSGLKPSFSDLPVLCERCDIPYSLLIEKIVASASRRIRNRATKAQLGHRDDIDQRCFRAAERVEAGAVLTKFWARERVGTPSHLTVQVDRHEHILLAPDHLQYINHSCKPNIFFDTTRFELVSLAPIDAGDELCYFYPSTEWDMDQPFACKCGSPECIGTIRGASELPLATLRRYRLSAHIESLLSERAHGG